jgi:hypothetical protein
MAAYTAIVTKSHHRVERMSRNFGFIIGQCNITCYNTTGAEITDITKYFDDNTIPIRVINDGLSTLGYIVRWDTTDKCFHALYPLIAHLHTITVGATHAGGAVELHANASGGALGQVAGAYTGITGIQNSAVASGIEVADDDVAIGIVNFMAIGWVR